MLPCVATAERGAIVPPSPDPLRTLLMGIPFGVFAGLCLSCCAMPNATLVCDCSGFGELALLYSSPRAASVLAITDCKLWVMERTVYLAIKRTYQEQLAALKRKMVASVPILAVLSEVCLTPAPYMTFPHASQLRPALMLFVVTRSPLGIKPIHRLYCQMAHSLRQLSEVIFYASDRRDRLMESAPSSCLEESSLFSCEGIVTGWPCVGLSPVKTSSPCFYRITGS